jgi:hypothetical protein
MSNKETGCSFCSTIVLSLVSIFLVIFLTVTAVDYSKNIHLSEHICEITHVDYPTTLPIMGDVSNWRECDCGKRCNAWGPTISLYTNVSDRNIVTSVRVNADLNYTFFNESCINGEDVRYTQIYMENARDIAMSYINTTIPCFYSGLNSSVYLNKNDDLPALIGLSTSLGVVIIIIIIGVVRCFREPENFGRDLV